MYKKIILFVLLFSFFIPKIADARIYILIDEASSKKFPIAVPSFLDYKGNQSSFGKKFSDLLIKDLKIAGLFDVVDDSKLPQKDKDTSNINFEKWQALEVGALVKGFVDKVDDKYVFKIKLYDVGAGKMILGKKFVVAKEHYIDAVHRFMDSLMESLTGTRGPFNSMIAASCGGDFKKTIGTFNMDSTKRGGAAKGGRNLISPAFSPAGGQIAYMAFNNGAAEIYVNGRQVTHFNSTTITPTWTPDGSNLVVASAFKGDTDLYLINLNGRVLRQLTHSRNIDFNPSLSGGGRMVFSSERAGGLHLFASSADGGAATQLTYTGYQNDQPDWSPDGTKIVFAGRDQGVFDIFIMEADGSNIQRLTRGEGSNEAPTWAPDSRYIAFSSTRGGIYVMLEDGTNQTEIEKSRGCTNLDWGPWLSRK
ncbi:MAG: hypothetical protein ABII18_11410 [bacterium]|nr:hypothetical protein [bacterium]MBU1918645.1 hypothetical protein [bacterium]